jgi:hypothetical protein
MLLMLFVVLVAAACAPPPNLRDENLLRDTSLITGQPCEAPCFRGIIPGETRWRDALTIIEDASDFSNVQTQADEESNAVQAAWQQGEGQLCCQMASQDGQTVCLIFLRTAPNMSIGQLIERYGDPTYIVGSEFTEDQAIMSVVYPDTPMVIYVFVPGAESGALTASSEIIGVLYLTPEEMSLLLQTTELHAWQGYQSYANYVSSPFEVTPSITLTPASE